LPGAGTAASSGKVDAVLFRSVSFAYRDDLVIDAVSFGIPQGAFVTLLGPSGCGKTTLLKLLGGYLTPSEGEIFIQGAPVGSLPPEGRQIGMVFQNYALFPHLNVRRNVAFGLDVRGYRKAVVREKVEAILDRVGLTKSERLRFPAQLSGGQQQRVALARAMAFDPPVLLLDEPLASLDRRLRQQLQVELVAIHEQCDAAALMVTHDQEEALSVSQLVGVMRNGRLIQFGTPQDVYFRPRTLFVARFLGDANLIDGPRLGRPPGTTVMIRPEQIRLDGDVPARVISTRFLGIGITARVQTSDMQLTIRCPADRELAAGDRISLDLPSTSLWEIPDPDDPP